MKFLLTEFKDFFKDKKSFFILLMVFYALYLIKIQLPDSYDILIKQFSVAVTYCINNYFIIVFFLINLLFLFALLKKSDKEFKILEREHNKDYHFYKSEEEYPISTEISLRDRIINDELVIEREIDIKNKLHKQIKQVEGIIEFYKNRVMIDSVEFKIDTLEPLRGVRVIDDTIPYKSGSWNEFITKIKKATSKDEIFSNYIINGVSFHETHFLILNRYKYIRCGTMRLPYEISWLKERILLDVIPRIDWHFGIKRSFRNKSFFHRIQSVLVHFLAIIYVFLLMFGFAKLLNLVFIIINSIIRTILSIYF